MVPLSRRKVLSLTAGLALATGVARAAERWVEGRDYFAIQPQPVPRKGGATITEVFSYGCPGCNEFLPYMQRLEMKLPAGVTVDYLPASWIAAENWPAFQRAYLTALALGVASKAHEAMFSAVWRTGELAIIDAKTGRLKSTLPSIQDVARLYQRVAGIPPAKFIETARSFSVDAAIRRSDELIKTYRAGSTPTIVVNGTFRVEPRSVGGYQQAVDLALWLTSRTA